MSNNKNIITELKCQNIAPIEDLTKEIKSSSLKMAVFANNGSGKTFLSRLFRLTENQTSTALDENGKSPTDMLLTFGKNSGSFSFKITDKEGKTKEDFSISITKGQAPTISKTEYLYHTFNQDYVEKNIRTLSYEKDSDIILGEANIDLTEDKENLEKIEKEGKELYEQIGKEIKEYLKENIDNITNITRLGEYKKHLNLDEIFNGIDKSLYEGSKSFDELLQDYNKVKSIPENLADIGTIDRIDIDIQRLNKIQEDLKKEFTLSSFADDFKQKIKSKQVFIEKGIALLSEKVNDICPFCEQELQENAISLIDNYTKYLNDTEAQTVKQFKEYIKSLFDIITSLKAIETTNSKRINSFNEYKTKYISASEKVELGNLDIVEIQKEIQEFIKLIEEKIENISTSILVNNSIIENIEKYQTLLNRIIDSNNEQIDLINSSKNNLTGESRNIRREICKWTYDHLVTTHKTNIKKVIQLREDWKTLNEEIKKKEEQHKASKKDKVASTIKTVLDYFFSGKYTLDEETFRLVFNKNTLEKDQAKEVLSEGEKNIIAFAYYIGDTHLKVERESDYKRLFFIIDDPISSMDFTYVYTLCGVIRDISEIIDKLERGKFIIFTHNNEFMRVLTSNKIIDKALHLKNGKLKDIDENFTVPYINHLIDIYNIARKGELPNHTTANSIRHIIETLTKFESISISKEGISKYIEDNIPRDKKSYTLINDLSHGGWRSEQAPITEDDYRDICEAIIKHIEDKYKGQIEYCKKSH